MFKSIIFSSNDGVYMRASGPHRIATHLRQQGWDIEVIDFFDYWELDDLKTLVKLRMDSNMKWIGFSYLLNNTKYGYKAIELRKWLKETYPDLLLVTGGQGTVDVFNEMKYADYHCIGYGEYAIDALLSYKFSNGPKLKLDPSSKLKGLQIINALDHYPAFPMRDPDIFYEDRDFILPYEWGTMEFSRGCRFKCAFCNFPVIGVKGDYTRSTESVERQMKDAYYRFGIENYLISDETFNDSTEKIAKFADVTEKLSWKPYFSALLRADLICTRPGDREELLRMGVWAHFYGVETFNPRTAKIIKKGYDPKKMQEGLLDINQWFKSRIGTDFRIDMGLIAGLPEETMESLDRTYEWCEDNWMDQFASTYTLELQSLNDVRKKSDISLDYGKHGYRLIERPENQNLPILVEGGHGLLWENDHMNIFEAEQWSRKFNKLYFLNKEHYYTGQDLGFIFCDRNGKPLPHSAKIKLKKWMHHHTDVEGKWALFFERYKNSKLNL